MLWMWWFGCSQPACDEAACADVCAAAEAASKPDGAVAGADDTMAPVTMSDFERGLVEPVLEDVRAGIRPFDDEGIGLCRTDEAATECLEYLGTDPGDLPPGNYFLRAMLRVPKASFDWKVSLVVSCTDATSEGAPRERTREYNVRYAGEKRGYRLQPLQRITSPNPTGPSACTYTLSGVQPDGEGKVYTGGWKLPAEG